MTIKVKKDTNPNKLFCVIDSELIKTDKIENEMIGADAVNQSVRAIAIARTFDLLTMLDWTLCRSLRIV